MSVPIKKEEEIVMVSPTYGRIINPEILAAFEETEEIIRKIKTGDRTGCMTLEEYKAEVKTWLEEDDEDEAI